MHASRTLSSQSSGTDIKKALTDAILIKKKERHEFHKLLFDIYGRMFIKSLKNTFSLELILYLDLNEYL